jgi:4-hydroxy-3-polyprenylbenzoate decarboxylase
MQKGVARYMGEVVVAITGASGAIYGKRLTECLSELGVQVRLIVTESGVLTLAHECQTDKETIAEKYSAILEDESNVAAKSASGSANIDAVVICPCSGTTLGKLAAGISDNLVTRSAIVAMKERRKLIIVPREAPYATVHLENMAKLSSWDTVIIPASPGFYNHPQSIDDLIDFVVARILDQLGLTHDIGKRWTGEEIQ